MMSARLFTLGRESMKESENRQLVLMQLPDELIGPEHFELRRVGVPRPGADEVLVRNLMISCDPTQRGWLNGIPTYMPAVKPGDVMPAWGAGQVVESNHADYRVGDRVWGTFSWQDYVVVGQDGLFPLSKIHPDVPITYPLGVTGITGVTAYIGMLDLGRPEPGQTVVVSAAAGATGSVAAQLAKLRGARVIGIAGGPNKCRWLTDGLSLDAAIDYKHEDVPARLRELCPDGIDVYYDNVGGALTDAIVRMMALFGRIVLCGIISQGHGRQPLPPLHNTLFLMLRSVSVTGFLIFNHMERFAAASEQLLSWVRQGSLVAREDVMHGLENAPLALRRLFEGKNFGKQLVKVADPIALG
jgi:NADPH-dependent curcumin reductase CurA